MREFVRHLHFVGIGGAGMSGIAAVLADQGYQISGSDIRDSSTTEWLRSRGVEVAVGHQASHVKDADVVVVSGAVGVNNPEILAAQREGIPVLPRAQILGELMRFRKGIAVAGTHGKTTTTSLIAEILSGAGLDPTFVVGGLVNSAQGGARLGDGEYLVAEADESDCSFLHLQPLVAVVTNVDADHLEAYNGDFGLLVSAFSDFLQRLPFYGLAVLYADDPVLQELRTRLSNPVITYGTSPDADYRAVDIRQYGPRMTFRICMPDQMPVSAELALAGRHNVMNALAATGIAHRLGVGIESILQSLARFQGVARRIEILGHLALGPADVLLVDDYAHHPTEIAATLDAVRGSWPERRLIVVFQPHRFTRTEALFDRFCDVLEKEPHLWISGVYAAGEAPISGADSASLCFAIGERTGKAPVCVDDLSQLKDLLIPVLQSGDLVLTLGAGDIGRTLREVFPVLDDSHKSACT
ncbi:MAG: UDP-N-acetylmuramate--L-alanine ligase [Pseudomonadota bacterium]|nr:UDP-N-acetylmuramate--L-alanine ligase [Pseudomonadota bacterium]